MIELHTLHCPLDGSANEDCYPKHYNFGSLSFVLTHFQSFRQKDKKPIDLEALKLNFTHKIISKLIRSQSSVWSIVSRFLSTGGRGRLNLIINIANTVVCRHVYIYLIAFGSGILLISISSIMIHEQVSNIPYSTNKDAS